MRDDICHILKVLSATQRADFLDNDNIKNIKTVNN